jgi:hypothetical protein
MSELDLVLQPPRTRDEDVNLLVVNEKWHGFQPYTFGAADFVNGAKDSTLGEERTVNIPGLQAQLVVDVIEVKVEAESPDQLGKTHYWFSKLVLRISMRESNKSGPSNQ